MLDGNFFLASEPILSHCNNGILYGDFFSFEIVGNSSKLFFPELFYENLIERCKIFNFDIEKIPSQLIFEQNIYFLLQKNRIYKSFLGIVTVFKNSRNLTSILISTEVMETEFYSLNKDGLIVDVLLDKPINKFLINTKEFQFLNYQKNFENYLSDEIEYLLIDDNSNIISTIDSNVFFVKNNDIFLPNKILENNIKIITDFLIDYIKKIGFKVENRDIRYSELDFVDEIFLVNIKYGIRWVSNYKRTKYYYHRVSKKIFDGFNKLLKDSIQNER